MNDKSKSIQYYNQHAEAYEGRTFTVDLKAIYEPFLSMLAPCVRILDAGCGTGRDSLYFKTKGYAVAAFDASIEMVKMASGHTGIAVRHARFEDFKSRQLFDAIWACASLLHIPRAEMPAVITQLSRLLKAGGVFYMSFKYGQGAAFRNERIFTDYDEARFKEMVAKVPELQIVQIWQTSDERKRNNGLWLNAILRKVES